MFLLQFWEVTRLFLLSLHRTEQKSRGEDCTPIPGKLLRCPQLGGWKSLLRKRGPGQAGLGAGGEETSESSYPCRPSPPPGVGFSGSSPGIVAWGPDEFWPGGPNWRTSRACNEQLLELSIQRSSLRLGVVMPVAWPHSLVQLERPPSQAAPGSCRFGNRCRWGPGMLWAQMYHPWLSKGCPARGPLHLLFHPEGPRRAPPHPEQLLSQNAPFHLGTIKPSFFPPTL